MGETKLDIFRYKSGPEGSDQQIGASKPEQIIENLKMTANASFTKEELEQIDSIVL